MCTAVSIWGKRHLFGRTLDVAHTYGEEVVLTPREAPLPCVDGTHHALLGVAHSFWGTPLYYDAVNEYGLVGAALRFPEETVYQKSCADKTGIPSYALLSAVLACAKTVGEAEAFLQNLVVTDEAVDAALPVTPLHWIFADSTRALTVESVKEGLMVYENPVGVLTNAPAFPAQLAQLEQGGVAGGLSSLARFERCAFYKTRIEIENTAEQGAADAFRLMETVSVPKGAVCTAEGEVPCTQYTVCVDADTRTYYYTTRGCHRIRAVTMRGRELDGSTSFYFPLQRAEDVLYL